MVHGTKIMIVMQTIYFYDDIIEHPDSNAVHTVSPASSEIEDGHDIEVNVDVHQSGEAVLEATPS
jgi:hypothetical protein